MAIVARYGRAAVCAARRPARRRRPGTHSGIRRGSGTTPVHHIAYARGILRRHGLSRTGRASTTRRPASTRSRPLRSGSGRRWGSASRSGSSSWSTPVSSSGRRAPARARAPRVPESAATPRRGARAVRLRSARAQVGGDGASRDDVDVLQHARSRSRRAHDRTALVGRSERSGSRRCARSGSARPGVLVVDIRRRRAGSDGGPDHPRRRAPTDLRCDRRDRDRDRGGRGTVVRIPGIPLHEPDLRSPPGAEATLGTSPASFYADLRLREVFSSPTAPHLDNRFVAAVVRRRMGRLLPASSSGTTAVGRRQPGESRTLVAQMFLAIVPTLLLVGGWLVLLGDSLTRRRIRESTRAASRRAAAARRRRGDALLRRQLSDSGR